MSYFCFDSRYCADFKGESMKLSEYLKELRGDVEVDRDALDNFLNIKRKGLWSPQPGQDCYYIDATGDVDVLSWYDPRCNSGDMYERLSTIGNCFKSREDADKKQQALWARAKLLKYGGRDYYDEDNKNWVIAYSPKTETPCATMIPNGIRYNPFEVYFDTKQELEEAVDKAGGSCFIRRVWFDLDG